MTTRPSTTGPDTSLATLRKRRPGALRALLGRLLAPLTSRPVDGLDRLLAYTDRKAQGRFRQVEARSDAAPRHAFTARGVPAHELAFGYLRFPEVRRLAPVMPGLMLRMLRSGRYYKPSLPEARTPAPPALLAELEAVARAHGALDVAYLNDVRSEEIFQGLALPAPGAILFTVEMDPEPIARAPSFDTFHEVATGYRRLAELAEAICDLLQARGHAAFPGTALGGTTDYVRLAARAGLGGIGFHGMLLTPQAGARVRIATVYTNLSDLPERGMDEHAWVTDFCAQCRQCVRSCPPAAIHPSPKPRTDGEGTACIDHVLCRDFFARSLGCAKCIAVCPFSTAGYAQVQQGLRAPPPAPDQDPRRFKVAIVGAGAAGFYAARTLLDRAAGVQINLLERMLAPGGLVRYGVAPDHPEVRSKLEAFDDTLHDPRVQFLGNVAVGRDITRDELLAHHDAVLYATGAPRSRTLGVEGEEQVGSVGAARFVGWINGHPDHAHWSPPLDHDTAVVVGAGNVALDVARMLASDVERLSTTDIGAPALDALSSSGVRTLHILARRGPERAAFTPRELRDLIELPGVQVRVRASDVAGERASTGLDARETRRVERVLSLLRQASTPVDKPARVVVHLHFHTVVEAIVGQDGGRVGGVRLRRSTGEEHTIECGLVVRAIGFRSEAVPGLPFDTERHIIPTDQGRVVPTDSTAPTPEFASGWVRRGPRGIIGAHKVDAEETVQTLLSTLPEHPRCPDTDLRAVLQARGVRVTDAADWDHLKREERLRGSRVGRTAIRHTDANTMWASLDRTARLGGPA